MAISGGGDRDEAKPVGRSSAEKGVHKDVHTEETKEVTPQKVTHPEELASSAPQTKHDIPKDVARLIEGTLQKLASTALQAFKLPGTDRWIHDQREKPPHEKIPEKENQHKIRDESKMSLEALLIKKGKLQGTQEKGYENYLADPAMRAKMPQPQTHPESKLSKLLSRFEHVLLARFEQGTKQAQEAGEGRFSFLKKTAEQWRSFFGHFTSRTVKRHVAMDHVESWIYRGFVQKNAKATVISDLALRNGQVEKFARFRLSQEAQNLANRLNQMQPGTKLSKEDLSEHAATDLEYLAIKNAEVDSNWAQLPTQGKFLKSAQAEEKVAGELGFQKEKILREKKHKKGGGLLGSEGERVFDDPPPQFIPWYSSGIFQKGKRGPVRWYVVVTYLVAASLFVLGLLALLRSF